MVVRYSAGALTKDEKKIAKALLDRGYRNQDIQALINIGRSHTINSARITEVKRDKNQPAASEQELVQFQQNQQSFDPNTGLKQYDNERLIRAREAMILAVQGFNSAGLKFKTELFVVLANIAWTYLLHEYFEKKGVQIEDKAGVSLLLSKMLQRSDCPLSSGTKNNLRAIKIIRDNVEHKLLGPYDKNWFQIFQACCLNFEKCLCEYFGSKLSISSELAFALQFSKLNFDHAVQLEQYELPEHISAIDAGLHEGMTPEQLSDLEYKFRVVYTLDSATKSKAHIEFISPESSDGKEIRSVLVKYKPSDELYPYKPNQVSRLVAESLNIQFTPHNHTQAWRLFNIRPTSKNNNPENTKKEYCIYHQAHKDYTYSQRWVDFLVEEVARKESFDKIKSMKVS
jgi:hypothetical protein